MLFEGFEVGQRYVGGPRMVTAEDLVMFTRLSGDDHALHTAVGDTARTRFGKPIFQASYGAAVAAGLWNDLGLVSDSVVSALEEKWQFHHPIVVGDELSLTVTVIRLQASRGGNNGTVTRFNELSNADGNVLQSGTATALVRAGEDSRQRLTNRDVGTVPWGLALAGLLGEEAAFASAVASWDGTIGLRGGHHVVHLRIYCGSVIDVTSRSPHGATFTLGGSDQTWADLLTAAEGQFGRRVMAGEFQISGDPYEYLRLTKALEIVADTARTLAASGDRIGLTA